MNIIKALSFYMEQQGWTKAELEPPVWREPGNH